MMKNFLKISFLSFIAILLVACTSQQKGAKSSVVDYLYPKETIKVEPSIPLLKLPIKMGVAFVPEQSGRAHAVK